MPDINFTCKTCVFAVMDRDMQVGCELNRLSILNPNKNYDENGEYQVFNRFCNAGRPKEWLKEVPEDSNPVEAVYEEIKPRVGLVVEFNDNLEDLEVTLGSISHQILCKLRYVIVITQKVEYNEEINQLLKQFFDSGTECKIVQLLIETEYLQKLDHAFRFAKNGWLVYIKAGYRFQFNFLNEINHRVNHDLKRFSVCVDSNQEKFVVHTPLYKALGGSAPKTGQDGIIDKRNFFDRLSDMSSSDQDSIIAWKEMFNE